MILSRISKRVLHSIPVLSIFALFGIITYAVIALPLTELSSAEVYAAETTSNNTSLIIDNGTATSSTATVRNGVAYSSHTVQVKADNIAGYTLSITGPVGLTGGTTITGAGGKTGSAMTDNTWGYGWNTTSTADANMTYNSFTGSAQTLETNNSATSANFTKKLVFAAKFNQNAAEGHYKANVKLNLTVTPKTVATYNYSVIYDTNGGGGGPSNAVIDTNDIDYTYTIPLTIPTKAEYKFIGWSIDGSSTVKYKQAASVVLSTTNPSITLTAVWQSVSGFAGIIKKMQDMTTSMA